MEKLIHNPVEAKAPISTIFEQQVFELKPGDTFKVTEETEPVAVYLLNKYGFLEVIDADKEDLEKVDKFICQFCGRECKAKIGLISHEKSCKDNPDNMQELTDKQREKAKKDLEKKDTKKEKIRTLKPKARLVRQGESRSERENREFGNTDMAGVVTGQERVETGTTGEKKKFSYDRDGVGWYGPGAETDNTDFTGSGLRPKNKKGKF